jgi:dihydrofolate reductase
MNVSLDLLIEGDRSSSEQGELAEQGEQGAGSWLRIGEPLHREFNRRARELALMVQGRLIYEIMEGFWPAARDNETLPDFMREYGEIWTSIPKVLVSNARIKANYNTRIIGGDVMAQLAELRQSTDGTIAVGGANLATQLLRHNLLDELVLFTHPVVLGRGRPLFGEVDQRVECDLLEHATFDGGVTLHRYEVRKAAR